MENTQKTTLVLGASTKPNRYSNMAVNRLLNNEQPTIAIGRRPGTIREVEIETSFDELLPGSVHTVTLYLNPLNQRQYYDHIVALRPKRLIFNPGTENPELCALVQKVGTECIHACTLVMLSTGQY